MYTTLDEPKSSTVFITLRLPKKSHLQNIEQALGINIRQKRIDEIERQNNDGDSAHPNKGVTDADRIRVIATVLHYII